MFAEAAIKGALEHFSKKMFETVTPDPYDKLLGEIQSNAFEPVLKEENMSLGHTFNPDKGNSPFFGVTPFDNALSLERRPEKMAYDVSARLINNGFTCENWTKCDVEGKSAMLKNALEIMAQEMMVPYNFGSIDLKIKDIAGNYEGITWHSILVNGNRTNYALTEVPNIEIDTSLVTDENFTKCIVTLYHEMIHVMQYAAGLEAVPYSQEVAYWRDNIINQERYKGNGYTSYYTSPIESYAHAQDGLFLKVFTGMLADNGLSFTSA